MKHFDVDDLCAEINRTMATIARQVVQRQAATGVVIAGVVTTDPYEGATSAPDPYRLQIQSLMDGGIDLLLIENVMRLDDLRWVLQAARDVGATIVLPIVISVALANRMKMIYGEPISEAVAVAEEFGAAGFGVEVRFNPGEPNLLFEYLASEVHFPLYLSRDVQQYQENAWSRSVESDAIAIEFYEECLALDRCCLIGGGRGTTFADVSQYRSLVDAS